MDTVHFTFGELKNVAQLIELTQVIPLLAENLHGLTVKRNWALCWEAKLQQAQEAFQKITDKRITSRLRTPTALTLYTLGTENLHGFAMNMFT